MLAGMAEGVATAAGRVVDDGIYDDPDRKPAPDGQRAPNGWTWDRRERRWRARLRPGRRPAPDSRPGPDDAGAGAGAGTGAGGPWEPPGPRDPDPGWMAGQAGGGGETVELSSETRKDIRATLALLYSIPADLMLSADPYCFGALNGNLTPVIDATSDIVCESPRVARWAASAGGLMLWVRLAAALRPFGVAVWHHHVIRDVGQAPDEVRPEGEIVNGAGPEYDYSQFPAAA